MFKIRLIDREPQDLIVARNLVGNNSGIFLSQSKKGIKRLFSVEKCLKTLVVSLSIKLRKVVLLHSMNELVTYISNILSEMNKKLSSME